MSKRDITEISVQEKRALEPLVRSRYQQIISDLRETESKEVDLLVQKIADKMKINLAFAKIKQLQSQILTIKDGIQKLGFETGSYEDRITGLKKDWDRKTNEQLVDFRTPAGKIYYQLTKARPDVRAIERQRDEALRDFWLSVQKIDAKEIMDRKIEVPQLEYKR